MLDSRIDSFWRTVFTASRKIYVGSVLSAWEMCVRGNIVQRHRVSAIEHDIGLLLEQNGGLFYRLRDTNDTVELGL